MTAMIRAPSRSLYVVVFISGARAIVYQTIWFRQLSLVLGSTSLALTSILTAFMLGLGLGGLWTGTARADLDEAILVFAVVVSWLAATLCVVRGAPVLLEAPALLRDLDEKVARQTTK